MADREQEIRDVRRGAVNELIDQIAGTVLTHLSDMAARCSNDLTVRRKIDQVVFQVRRAISEAFSVMVDAVGEPPLEQQISGRPSASLGLLQYVRKLCGTRRKNPVLSCPLKHKFASYLHSFCKDRRLHSGPSLHRASSHCKATY